MRFFFVPVGRSVFADWMGKQDPWYGRNVTCLTQAYVVTYPNILPPIPINFCEKNARKSNRVSKLEQQQLHTQSLGDLRSRSSSIAGDGAVEELRRTLMLADIGGSQKTVLCSKLKLNSRKKKRTVMDNPLSPKWSLRSGFESYFREANNIIQVKIFQCECWYSDSLQNDLIIPFILYAEIGADVEYSEVSLFWKL